jgi:hypothetical protein
MAQAPFVINPALVAIAIDYAGVNRTARGYIADRVAPRMPVDAPLFRYPEYNLADAFTVYDNQVDRLGRLNEITSSATETVGETRDYGILEKVPFRDEAAARGQSIPMALKTRAVRHVIDVNQLNREIRVSAATMSLANYAPGYSTDLTAGTKWSDYNNSDPVTAVRKAQLGMLVRPNVGVTSEGVMDVLSRHPKLAVALGGQPDSGRVLSNEEIARALKLERIEVGSTIKQTSKRGQNLVTGAVWPDSFAMHYQGPMTPTGEGLDMGATNFLATFQWGGIVSGENLYRPAEMGLWGGVGVYTGESLVEKRVAPFAGYLFANVLAAV